MRTRRVPRRGSSFCACTFIILGETGKLALQFCPPALLSPFGQLLCSTSTSYFPGESGVGAYKS